MLIRVQVVREWVEWIIKKKALWFIGKPSGNGGLFSLTDDS